MATIKDGKGTLALAAFDTTSDLKPHEIGRPSAGPDDVSIDILYCGMCHSDLHATNGDWGIDSFPLVPGHEMAGVVTDVGKNVSSKFKVGDKVGVGCFVDSCSDCKQCQTGFQNYCSDHVQSYSSMYRKRLGHDDCAGHHTNGGYSSQITVKGEFVYHAPKGMDLKYVGPLLCAGITMFSPLNRHVLSADVKKSVAILGFGGLGQMGAKLALAMGSKVTVLSRSDKKASEAKALGAELLVYTDKDAMKKAENTFDVILDTVSAQHPIMNLLPTLKVFGTLVAVGGVMGPTDFVTGALLGKNLKVEGTMVGGVPETQQMLDFCEKHNVLPEIDVIHAKEANAHFQKLKDGSAGAKRAVIDMKTLQDVHLKAMK